MTIHIRAGIIQPSFILVGTTTRPVPTDRPMPTKEPILNHIEPIGRANIRSGIMSYRQRFKLNACFKWRMRILLKRLVLKWSKGSKKKAAVERNKCHRILVRFWYDVWYYPTYIWNGKQPESINTWRKQQLNPESKMLPLHFHDVPKKVFRRGQYLEMPQRHFVWK